MQAHRKSQNASRSNDDLTRWNTIAREYDAHITQGDFFRTQLLNPAVYELLGATHGKRILDAGCGQGYLAHALSERGAHVTAIDGSENLIDIARSHYKEGEQLRFTTHNLLESLPFPDATFDIALANMVLMDLDPITPVLCEIARTLKPDGAFVFSILHPLFSNGIVRKGLREHFTRALPFYALRTYASTHKKDWRIPGTTEATHVYARSLETYMRSLHNAGLLIADIREPVFPHDAVAKKDGAMRLLAEIPMFLIVRAHKRAPRTH